MTKLFSITFVALGLLSACGSAVPAPSSAQLTAAREGEPDVTMADLERGRSTYVARCATCHALQEPKAKPADKWPGIVEEMRTVHKAKLTDDEARDVVRYLTSASRVSG